MVEMVKKSHLMTDEVLSIRSQLEKTLLGTPPSTIRRMNTCAWAASHISTRRRRGSVS